MLKSMILSIIFNEVVVKKIVLASLRYFAKKSTNKLDDSIVESVAEAWNK